MTQHDVDRPLFPEQGCLVLVWMEATHAFVRAELDARTAERIYDDSISSIAWDGVHHVLEIGKDEQGRPELQCWDPSALIRHAGSYCGTSGRQWPDRLCRWPNPGAMPDKRYLDTRPQDYWLLQYTAVQYDLGVRDHYVRCDNVGLHIGFDPAPGRIHGWGRTGIWRGVQIWRS